MDQEQESPPSASSATATTTTDTAGSESATTFLTPSRHPQRWVINGPIPDIFSFPQNTESIKKIKDRKIKKFLKLIESLTPVINALAQGKKVSTHTCDIDHACRDLQEAVRLTNKKKRYNSTIYLKANLCLFFLLPHSSFHTQRDQRQYLAPILDFKDRLSTSELWWYYTCALWFLYDLSYQDQAHRDRVPNLLLEAAQHMDRRVSPLHYDAVLEFALKFSRGTSYYPDITFFRRLKALTPPEKPWDYDGECVNQRHDFIKKYRLRNREYFELQNSPLIDAQESGMQTISIPIPKEECLFRIRKFKIEISNKRLFKYAFHIVAPTPPIPQITAPDISKEQSEQLSLGFQTKLKSQGLCTSQGFLSEEVQFKKNRLVIEHCLIEALKERGMRTDNQPPKDWYDKFIQENRRLTELPKRVAGFSSIGALFFFRESLIPVEYGLPSPLLMRVKRSVSFCLEIADEADKIAKNTKLTDPQRHEQWFDLAKRIVTYLEKSQENLIIAIGTPQKQREYSEHAIYVVFKYLPKIQRYQIIITNGGLGVTQFHILLCEVGGKDREEYHYAAFKPFSLTEIPYKNALQHYIYKIISLEFTKADQYEAQCEGQNEYAFKKLLRNVYLRSVDSRDPEEYFYGNVAINPGKIAVFKRQDLNECFLEQIAGNCTVHNLKQALKILFDMDRITFGLLEDNLVLGLDNFISQYLTGAPSATQAASSTRKEDSTKKLLSKMDGQTEATDTDPASDYIIDIALDNPKRVRTFIEEQTPTSLHTSFEIPEKQQPDQQIPFSQHPNRLLAGHQHTQTQQSQSLAPAPAPSTIETTREEPK